MHAPFSKLNEKCFFFWNAFWLIWNRDCGKVSLDKKKHDTFQQELMERNIDSRALDSTVWQMDRVGLTWLTACLLHSDICSYRLQKIQRSILQLGFFSQVWPSSIFSYCPSYASSITTQKPFKSFWYYTKGNKFLFVDKIYLMFCYLKKKTQGGQECGKIVIVGSCRVRQSPGLWCEPPKTITIFFAP